MSNFRFSDYDCIGFDLDHTLLWYNVTNMVEMEYKVLAKFLVEEKGYDRDLLNDLSDEDLDFMQKGLCLDFDSGNILKPCCDGIIREVSHGMTKLSPEEMKKAYPSQRFEPLERFRKNPLDTWNGPHSLKFRCFLDYFDMPAVLAFAKIVDMIDRKNNGPLKEYNIWPDIYAGLSNMYNRTHFKNELGNYFLELKNNPDKYLRKCSQKIINWLREIKKTKVTFLITGSNADFANFTASHTIGNDWRELFDIVICFARKPGFFIEDKPFYSVENYEEGSPVSGVELVKGGIYSQGNWNELKEFFQRITGKDAVKCLYHGDNLIQDVFIPSAEIKWDTVVVSEEMNAEGMIETTPPHPDAKTMKSKYWGSYFSVENSNVKSLSSYIIENYSKICIPSIKNVASKPLDKTYEAFDGHTSTQSGYFPSKPVGLQNI